MKEEADMTKKLQLILTFITGTISGGIIYAGMIKLLLRDSWHVGGEVLIPMLLVLLIYFGWNLGNAWREHQLSFEKSKAYHEGFIAGIRKAGIPNYQSCRHQWTAYDQEKDMAQRG